MNFLCIYIESFYVALSATCQVYFDLIVMEFWALRVSSVFLWYLILLFQNSKKKTRSHVPCSYNYFQWLAGTSITTEERNWPKDSEQNYKVTCWFYPKRNVTHYVPITDAIDRISLRGPSYEAPLVAAYRNWVIFLTILRVQLKWSFILNLVICNRREKMNICSFKCFSD